MRRIGKYAIFGILCFRGLGASEVQFFAEVEPKVVGLQDEVQFTLTVQADTDVHVGEVAFEAPDFELIHESSSVSVRSEWIQGRGSTTRSQKKIKVLRPKKLGTLQISGIQVRVGSSLQTAGDLSVRVEKEAPQASRNVRQSQRSVPREQQKKCFVQAEADQQTVFKGQQMAVSYALYCQVQVLGVSLEKQPTFSGFFKEDLPIHASEQKSEAMVGGERYRRTLLSSYLLYPLQEGELSLDSLSLHYQYQGSAHSWDDEDPFFGFFQQIRPQVGSAHSLPVSIQVLGLPEQDRPSTWSGGIGKFSLSASLDRSEVPAQEAVTLTLKVEGSGNLAAITSPKTAYPPSLELYDTKGRMEGEGKKRKIFEFLLVPRVPGKLLLPPQVLSFFDPMAKKYYTLQTEALPLHVLAPLPGKASSSGSSDSSEIFEKKEVQDLRYLKVPGKEASWRQAWKWLTPFALGLAIFLGGWLLWDRWQSRSPRLRKGFEPEWWSQLQKRVASESFSSESISEIYDEIVEEVLTTLDTWYGLNWKSMSRGQWKRLLLEEKAMPEATWEKIHSFLLFAEQVRFSHRKQASWESSARSDLLSWIQALTEVLASFR